MCTNSDGLSGIFQCFVIGVGAAAAVEILSFGNIKQNAILLKRLLSSRHSSIK